MRTGCRKRDYIPAELAELRRVVDGTPCAWRGELLPLCHGLSDWSRRQSRLVQAAQEAVDQMRLDIKYLRFDLDATRRERDAMRQQEGHD